MSFIPYPHGIYNIDYDLVILKEQLANIVLKIK